MIREATKTVSEGKNLAAEQARAVMDEMMEGRSTPAQTAAFLTALAVKGASLEEITACAAGMRSHAKHCPYEGDLLDIVGTGGDGSLSFNISTASAFVAAAGGAKVGKHGNRAASSACGAADVLEALGAVIREEPEQCIHLLDTVGMCFFFAQSYHPAMKYVAPVRKEIGIRTIFNILGPLTNPAGANQCVIGVFDEKLTGPLARVLSQLGVVRGMVVYGQDGMDEISISAPTTICSIDHGHFESFVIRPDDFGLPSGKKADLVGGSAEDNAHIIRELFNGRNDGVYQSRRTAVILNAGAGLYMSGKASSLLEGTDMASGLIRSGEAMKKLDEFVRVSRSMAS